MKEFNVQVLFSGLVNITVEAETEDEAIEWVEENFYSEADIQDSNIDETYVTSERDID
jgi:hypothetical protein